MPTLTPRAARRALTVAAALATAALTACQDPVASVGPPLASADPLPGAAGASTADATLAWNELARQLVVKHAISAPASIRSFALLSVAQHDAIAAAEQGPRRTPRPSDRGAIAAASAAVLAYAYPQEQAALAAMVAAQRAAPPSPNRRHDDFVAGEAIGQAVATSLIARAETDRYFAPFTGTVPVCPGCWLATSPPAFATLGQAKPYFLTRQSQFRPAPPPAFGSPAFLADLAEVRRIADTRTAEQDSIARFWALPVGTVGAQGYLNEVAAELVRRYRRSERDAARTFALLNVAAYDAIVASHEAKYHYWLIRPSQADPGIVRAIGLPSFPSYPSNHSALVAAAATVLTAQFPAERAELAAMAEQGAMSRLYGGIHYRFDADAGLTLGRQVATWTLAHDPGRGRFVLP